jgi:hypothetical protein
VGTEIQTIVHPHVTISKPHFDIPSHDRDLIDGCLMGPSLQGSGMIGSRLSRDLQLASPYAGLYLALPGEYDSQVKNSPLFNT